MDNELKQYLEEMSAEIMARLERLESRIVSALRSREEPHLDPVARKLEGKEDDMDPDQTRIQAGH